jgi:hypothetical protein
MIAHAGREIATLVEGALSKSEGKNPRQVYSEVEEVLRLRRIRPIIAEYHHVLGQLC